MPRRHVELPSDDKGEICDFMKVSRTEKQVTGASEVSARKGTGCNEEPVRQRAVVFCRNG